MKFFDHSPALYTSKSFLITYFPKFLCFNLKLFHRVDSGKDIDTKNVIVSMTTSSYLKANVPVAIKMNGKRI